MKTYSAKQSEIQRDWYLVDADGQTLGRLARQQITKLKIYVGPEHPHEAQAPKPF